MMIYLDSAATSLLKPKNVASAMTTAMRTMASPGRGGHAPAMRAADKALSGRQAVADLFSLESPEKVVFTMNATHALNIAIATLVHPGDKVVISGYEHNSVVRPLAALHAEVKTAASPLWKPQTAVEAFRRELPGAKCAVCCHVSNVFGYILPVKEIAELCRENSVPLIIDASQSAGAVDIEFGKMGAEFIAMPGHKGLLGPQGTGVLLCRNTAKPLLYGGSGTNSISPDMPDFLPDRLEAGTHNIPGIAGLQAGIEYVIEKTTTRILRHERGLMQSFADQIKDIPGLTLYRSPDIAHQTGVLSVTYKGADCETIAEALGAREIAVRAGLHCSPEAHRTAGTIKTGTVRFSFSPFNTQAEIAAAARTFTAVLKKF